MQDSASTDQLHSPSRPIILSPGVHRVILTGFMGAGKSTVGRLLADLSGWNFLDLDTHLEEVAGKSAKHLYAEMGEIAFRQLEAEIFADALRQSEVVIAPGGAVIDKPESQALLAGAKGSYTIFLDAPFETLIARCVLQEQSGTSTYRPLLHQRAVAQARYEQRKQLYAAHADLLVDVADRTPAEVLRRILHEISAQP